MKTTYLITISLSLFVASLAQATEKPPKLSDITVSTATGIEQPFTKVPATVTVITAQDIENMGARDIDQVLSTVPGLHVAYSYINYPLLSIRGVSTVDNPEVLLLINGIRLNNAQKGSIGTIWSGLPVNSIARIEVIRGPASALYGAEALAGVINIITKQAHEIDGTEFGVRAGSFSTRDGWLLHGGRWHGFDIVATFEYNDTEGHDEIIAADAQTILDQQFGTQASYAPGPFNGARRTYDARLDIARDKWRLRGGVHIAHEIEVGVGVTEALDPNGNIKDNRYNADFTYQDDESVENWELTAQLSYLETRGKAIYYLFPPGAFGGAFPIGYISQLHVAERHTRGELRGVYSGLSNHLFRISAGYVYDELYETAQQKNFGPNPFTGGIISPTQLLEVTDTEIIFNPEASRKNSYLALQDIWSLSPHWDLTTGLRYDHYSDLDSMWSGQLGLVWAATSDLTAKLLYGRGFHIPGFAELYTANNQVQLGNPDLEPETIDSVQLALNYAVTQDFHTMLSVFTYEVQDKILYLPDPVTAINTASNAADWEGRGFELEAYWHFAGPASKVVFNYAFQDGEDDKTGFALGSAPKHQAYLRTDWAFMPLWSLHGQVNWAANWARPASDPRDKVDDYATFDLMLRRKDLLRSHTAVAIGVRNLFDEDVHFPSRSPGVNVPGDYPQAGLSFFAEFRYQYFPLKK